MVSEDGGAPESATERFAYGFLRVLARRSSIDLASSLLTTVFHDVRSGPSRACTSRKSRCKAMRTAAIRMALHWRVIPEETTAMMSALQTVLVRTRRERGCISCSLSTEVGSHVDIRYVADWDTEDDLQRHIRSTDFSKLAELMERGIEPPAIEFALPSGIRGMDYAEKIRGIRRQAYRH